MGDPHLLLSKLEAFISKYYKNILLKGTLYFVATSLLFFLLFTGLEHFGQFGTTVRTLLFWSFILLILFILWHWIITPLKGLYRVGKSLSHEEAANIIGKHFKAVSDKLLNLLQLQELSDSDNALIQASIEQKSMELTPIPFLNAIDFGENKQYIKYVLIPISILLFLFFSGNKGFVTDSASRILSHNTHFDAVAPFEFIIKSPLYGVKGNDFLLEVELIGDEIPQSGFIHFEGKRHLLKQEQAGTFSFLFKNPQEPISFQLAANGFFSSNKLLDIAPKPIVKEFQVFIDYPNYTGKKNETLQNIGNLNIPLGSHVRWLLETKHTEQVFFHYDSLQALHQEGPQSYSFEKKVITDITYGIFSQNEQHKGDSIFYQIKLTPDAYPSIKVDEHLDSNNVWVRLFNGYAQDDYGISALQFHYRILNDSSSWQSEDIALNNPLNQQQFYYYWDLNQIELSTGTGIEYYFEVWDNDAINGNKSSRSQKKYYNTPTQKELEEVTNEDSRSLKTNIEKSQELAKEVQEDMEALRRELLSEKEMRWEDQQKAKDVLKKQQALKKAVEDIQQEQKQLQNKRSQFEKPSEEMLQKQEQIQQLFENIMSEEMKSAMEQLQEELDDIDKEQLKKALEQLQQNDEDLSKELDRTLELFKQIELEQKLEQSIQKIQELADRQESLSEETRSKKTNPEELKKKQASLQKEFEELQEKLRKAEELNQELENQQEIADTKQEEDAIKQQMQESLQELQQKMQKKSAKSQKEAAEKLNQMSQKLQSSMQTNESESQAEDMETLRQILENLITLSLEQELLLTEIEETNINSPLYTTHMHQQKKLVDDAQIIEDSLFALSKRQPQIESIVNKEINTLHYNMNKALAQMEERFSSEASEQQQFAMTAANNLALLLSEVLEKMQKQADNAGDKMCNKPKNIGEGSVSKMRQKQQELLQQMKGMLKKSTLQKGSKGEKQQNKQLAQMAAQQEMIRQRMQELREELSGDQNAKQSIDRMLQQMEQTETDLINKNLTQETLLRQQEILTRLLESEKAHREREKEERRESQEWLQNISKRLVNPFEEYQKEKKRQEELLRTTPPNLTPFYKNKVNEYFQNEQQ